MCCVGDGQREKSPVRSATRGTSLCEEETAARGRLDVALRLPSSDHKPDNRLRQVLGEATSSASGGRQLPPLAQPGRVKMQVRARQKITVPTNLRSSWYGHREESYSSSRHESGPGEAGLRRVPTG